MPNVFSDLLGGSILCAIGTTDLGNPPDGYKWIVKDISVIQQEGPIVHAWPGWSVEDNLQLPIFARHGPWCIGGALYEWHGAQVVEFGTYLYFVSLLGTWRCRVSGYQLKLP